MGTIDTIINDRNATGGRVGSSRGLRSVISRLFVALRAWSVKRRSRSALRDLTEDQLRDIGLTPNDVGREVAKSFFWD